MKRLLIILFCLPLLFACQKDEPFEEGQEVVLNLSVDMGDMQSAATRAMGDNVEGTPALWLVVFDSEGYLVEWTKAKPSTDAPTTFKAELHATLEGRIMHFLLNYVDDDEDLQFDYGHENNIIGGLTVERTRDVYWQRVELPEGINGSTTDDGTAKKYLTKVPLVRNFSKIKVTEACDHFELLGFYVLNVPKRGTVAPFINGSFVKYYNENAQFNGASFTPKNYATLNTEGYTGTMPDNDERINKHTEFKESMQLLGPTDSYYLYESTYIKGNKDKTVSVLLKGKYNDKDYWYRVDLVKPDAKTGVIEYFDVLRNFIYTINITHVTAGKTSAKDAIEQPAGNNILSSLDIAHLTNVSDGTATLEVNYTDTVLISNDEVTVRYKFSDTGSGAKTNANIASVGDNDNDGCGWYLTYDGQTAPVGVTIAGNNSTDGWRDVTIRVNDATITERKEVSITFFATSSTQTVLSRTVHYTLMPQQPMLVECPTLVPATVGSEFNVNILIPDGLPEAMFPLDFAIESQAAGNTSYLAQYITPANSETVSVKTDGSIVDISNLNGKKSFQYVVTLSYADYKKAVVTERTLNTGQQPVSMRLYPTLFKTNTAQSASTIYAYNRYFTLGKDNFANGDVTNFTASFTNDNTATYGVGHTITLNLIAGDAGKYIIETTTLQVPTRAPLAELTMTAGATQQINLITSTFAEQAQILITCEATGVSKVIRGVERNTLNAKAKSLTYNGQSLSDTQSLGVYKSEDDAVREANRVATSTVNALLNNGVTYMVAGLAEADLLYFSYSDANNVYVASAKASDLSANSAELKFEQREVVANITDITLSGDKYYGENKALTLKFTTDRPGVYTITLTEGGESITQTYNVETAGTKTINQDWLKTQTWSDQVTVTISGVNATESIVGAERNTIKFGQLTLSASDDSTTSGRSVTIKINGTQVATNVSSGNLSGYEFTRANVNSSDNVELSYKRNSGGTYVSSQLIENLINDISVTFTKQ
jgi:hypothetical protein